MVKDKGKADNRSVAKNAIIVIEKMQKRLDALEQKMKEPIAIIGMGCRFPGNANSPQQFWQLLAQGTDAIREIPADRWDSRAYYDPDPDTPGKMSTRWGGFLEQIDTFDAAFFGISPREASWMDPQQRLLLEVAWEAFEDAGQVPSQLAGSRTGVFMGVGACDYSWDRFADMQLLDAYTATGNAHSIAANRLSYAFDLQGPSIAIDTACSSSLAAVHLACQSLRQGDCQLALAGGVNLMFSPHSYIMFSKSHMLAPDGRCKTFDARADGFVRGEGCGIIILKRLSQALTDGDRILALIRGSAVNQDGRTNGLMAPNSLSQQVVLRQALEQAGVAPAQVGYIEAHGTGTSLGDPIEMEALLHVYQPRRSHRLPCFVGSVKTNIGHLEFAAGIAGLMKVVLSLQHKTIPPHLHFRQLNPNISLQQTAFSIPTTSQVWFDDAGPRIGAVSAFGFGGTNAHVILQEAPHDMVSPEKHGQSQKHHQRNIYLLPLSARSPQALQELAATYRDHLQPINASLPDTYDLCASASLCRDHLPYRLAVQGHTTEELVVALDAFLQGEQTTSNARGTNQHPRLVFVYSGQGAQWLGMGRQLLEQETVFREAIFHCDALLRTYTSHSFLPELQGETKDSHLDDTEIAQPAIFAVQVALTKLWQSWGIVPDAVIGHSMGEVAAAHVAGIISLEEAVCIIFHRGRLMQRATGHGQMLEAELTQTEAEQLIQKYRREITIAAINSPTTLVLSGEMAAIQEILESLKAQGVFARLLAVNYAFHCVQMDPFIPELAQALSSLQAKPARLPFVSTILGRQIRASEMDATYWTRNMREPVLFAKAVTAILQDQSIDATFLEIAPHPVLARAITQCQEALERDGAILPSLRRNQEEQRVLLSSLGRLYSSGYSVNWRGLYPEQGNFVSLPSYPWQRQRFWLNPIRAAKPVREDQHGFTESYPLLGQKISSPLITNHLYQSRWNTDFPGFFKDHRIYGKIIIPAVAYLEMVLSAAVELFGVDSTIVIEDMIIQKPLQLEEGHACTVQLLLTTPEMGKSSFQVVSEAKEGKEITWNTHVTGTVSADASVSGAELPLTLTELQARQKEEISPQTYYQELQGRGFEYGLGFRGIRRLWSMGMDTLGEVQLFTPLASEAHLYQIHPCLLEACLQVTGASAALAQTAPDEVYIPIIIDCMRFYGSRQTTLWSYSRLRSEGRNDHFQGDVSIFDQDGQLVAEVTGMHLRRAQHQKFTLQSLEWLRNMLYEVHWQKKETGPLATAPAKQQETWLIFADPHGVGEACARTLRTGGHSCHLIFPGEAYQLVQPGYYHLNPASPSDFQCLLNAVLTSEPSLDLKLLHLWSLHIPSIEEAADTALDAGQVLGCGSVLYLIQAIVASKAATTARLWLITRGTQVVDDVDLASDGLAVEQAPLWGLGKVIALELPELWGGLVDLAAERSNPKIEAMVLLQEMKETTGEVLVAVRGEQRYNAHLMRSKVQKTITESLELSSNGTYMITGGLGGLGFTVASWMVERGVKHLVLIGRHSPSDEIMSVLHRWEERGVTVEVAQKDVARSRDIADLIATIAETEYPLRGIIHAAGLLDDGILQQQDWTRFTRVTAPKVWGTWNLHTLTKDIPLDFFVVFSSATSILGSPSQGNYAAANAFMDTLMHYRRRQGLPALSINWGGWSKVGMATTIDRLSERRWLMEGVASLTPEQGVKALAWILQQTFVQITVLPIEWSKFFRALSFEHIPVLLTHLANELQSEKKRALPDTAQARLRQRLEQAPSGQRQKLIEAYLREQMRKTLGLDATAEIEAQRGFFDLGMDSLMAIELKNSLQTSLKCTLPSTVVFDYPTIALLSKYLKEKIFPSVSDIPPPAIEQEVNTMLAEIESLSESETIALLEKRLSREGF